MKKLVAWLFSRLGYVPGTLLAEAGARSAVHGQTIRTLQEECASLKVLMKREAESTQAALSARDDAMREILRHRWQTPSLAALPSIPAAPQEVHRRTLDCVRILQNNASSPLDLCKPSAFNGNEDLRVLYWSLAHASAAAHRTASRLSDENEISTEFLNALTKELSEQASNGGTSSLRIGVNKIFGNVSPALKRSESEPTFFY